MDWIHSGEPGLRKKKKADLGINVKYDKVISFKAFNPGFKTSHVKVRVEEKLRTQEKQIQWYFILEE